ncbi:hypothetical protein [Myroides guanonis]|uniref:Uncharacterized protein n=1 Tax=Myroides guanonis TaxID=1150112 RepID=A0A1I3U3P7_9FLAO|nr:hypothetical protein [Myroides guanonis]SFJ76506.1 hypothetical protein SAMN04487893_11573 [Myroides guanonis]
MEGRSHAYLVFVMLSNLAFAQNKEVVFEIQNSFVQDSLMVDVKITNNTDKDIWLPIDTFTLAYDQTMPSIATRSFFTIRQNIFDKKENQVVGIRGEEGTDYLSDFGYMAWADRMKNKTINDIVLIPKGQSKILSVYFYFYHRLNSLDYFCFIDYENFENGQYDFYLSYQMNPESIEKYLSKEILDELKAKGYEPYFGKIESNRVPLVID